MLELQKFILEHDNWKKFLKEKPYHLTIHEKDNLIIFKYNQILSDFSNPIVQECRGIILEKDTWKVVRLAFYKFFNYGESNAAQLDWSSAVVTEKVDGSLMSIFYYNGEWRVASNGTIDARDADMQSDPYENFRQLFDAAVNDLDYDKLDKNCCYTVELRSPFNKIIVPYKDIKIIHLSTRDMTTLEEIEVDIGLEKPKVYELKTLDDCIEMAKTFDFTQEGFVARDKYYNRVKIKSPEYVIAHKTFANKAVTKESIMELIHTNETSEFLNYFPEYKSFVTEVRKEYSAAKRRFYQNALYATTLMMVSDMSKKEFALKVKDLPFSAVCFKIYDNNFNLDLEEFWRGLKVKFIMRAMEGENNGTR